MNQGVPGVGDDRPLPSSPTGRVPQWVRDEAAGVAVPPVPWRSDGFLAVPARRRRSGFRALLAVALVVALSLGASLLAEPGRWPWNTVPGTPVPGLPAGAPDRPTAGAEAASSPRGRPRPAPVEGGTHGFLAFQADGVTPVAYDPCRPVHYVVRPDGAPPGGAELIRGAVARLGEVTGLQFIEDGATDEASTRDREPFQPDRYGDRWAPVLIAWETDAENPSLAGEIVGEAGSVAVSVDDGPRVFLTGTVSLDAGQFPGILAGADGAATARAIVLHELGHLVGLAHVDDVRQLMYPETQPGVLDFAAGDLTGLAALGSGPCVPQV